MNNSVILIALWTIVYKEMKRILRIWTQTLLPSAITTALYFIIFGHVIGQRIGDMQGHQYIQFIAPGLIMMSVIANAYGSTSSAFFSAKFNRSIEEVLVSPVPNYVLVLGYMLGGMFRGVLVGTIVSVIALFFTHLHIHSLSIIIVSTLFSTAIFALLGVLNGIFAKKFDDIAIVPTFLLTPLSYLGGVFYSISLLPKFWYYLSFINPIVYIIDNFRYGFLAIPVKHLFFSFSAMLFFIILLFMIALRLVDRGSGLRE